MDASKNLFSNLGDLYVNLILPVRQNRILKKCKTSDGLLYPQPIYKYLYTYIYKPMRIFGVSRMSFRAAAEYAEKSYLEL